MTNAGTLSVEPSMPENTDEQRATVNKSEPEPKPTFQRTDGRCDSSKHGKEERENWGHFNTSENDDDDDDDDDFCDDDDECRNQERCV